MSIKRPWTKGDRLRPGLPAPTTNRVRKRLNPLLSRGSGTVGNPYVSSSPSDWVSLELTTFKVYWLYGYPKGANQHQIVACEGVVSQEASDLGFKCAVIR